ncbi:MAG: metallophosphoesterase [Eubacteriaceae bacterium]|nr:metallophosphoesterase [Eubacteriaceae bacterium]
MAYSRVFITGDIHGDYDIAKIDLIQEKIGKELAADPADKLLLVCGDFGMIFDARPNDWERKMQAYYHNLYDTTGIKVATCLGNHENYDRIYTGLPVTDWCGDKIRRTGRDGPGYLVNGGYYTIPMTAGAFTLLAMGGAASHDYPYRKAHVSWWPQEIPSTAMLLTALQNLKAHGGQVDRIITHTIPYSMKVKLFDHPFEDSLPNIRTVERQLQVIDDHARYTQWFAGHHHVDITVPEYQLTLLYNGVVELLARPEGKPQKA